MEPNCLLETSKRPEFVGNRHRSEILNRNRSLVHELDDLVFISELWQRVLLLAFHKVLQAREAGDLEAIPHRLVHGGVHCCQHAGTLEKYQTTNPE